MSRCFPYPPPGYVRNPVAVAEAETTAKLQKERENAGKRKEKKSDRKALQQGGMSKHSKHNNKKRKHEDIGTVGQEPKTLSKESIEQLEKSGLSEEHGAPCSVRTVLHSPESSQDSSKRRKVVLPSPSQSKNGNIVRIKIKRDQDSPRSVLQKPTVLEQPPVKQIGLGSSQLSKPNSTQQQDKVNVKPAAATHQRISMPQAMQKQGSTQLPSKFSSKDDPKMAKVVPQIDSKLSVKPPISERVDLQRLKMAQTGLPGNAAVKVLQSAPVASAEIQRKCPPACSKDLLEATDTIGQLQNLQASLVPSLKLVAPGVNQLQRPIASVAKEEPSSSGRNADAVQGKEVKQSKSDRKKSRKAEKKEKKLRGLFDTWNPPSFDMEDSDVGGQQDWLLGGTRNLDACITNCRASDGSVPFQSIERLPSFAPMATFLPDLGIYQLPYVVPF